MFATELVKPIEAYLTEIPSFWAVDRHSYNLVSSDSDDAFCPQYRVLPYSPNSLDNQPQTANVLSVQYMGSLGRQWLGEADARSHQFRLASVSANQEICQNNRDYAVLAISRGIVDRLLNWTNYDYLGQFAIVARVPPTRDARDCYVCSASFIVYLGRRDGNCTC